MYHNHQLVVLCVVAQLTISLLSVVHQSTAAAHMLGAAAFHRSSCSRLLACTSLIMLLLTWLLALRAGSFHPVAPAEQTVRVIHNSAAPAPAAAAPAAPAAAAELLLYTLSAHFEGFSEPIVYFVERH
jgi:hypothetical protein